MVSTVTTTVTTVAMLPNAPALAIIGVLLLIGLLVTKELSEASINISATRLARAVNIGIFPLLFVFALIVLTKIQAAIY
ncbi:MAG: hypothetical protein MUP44_09815 [Anaerolineales bacterium]|nr:hypothetical protein [Anaerolineales bacterium]